MINNRFVCLSLCFCVAAFLYFIPHNKLKKGIPLLLFHAIILCWFILFALFTFRLALTFYRKNKIAKRLLFFFVFNVSFRCNQWGIFRLKMVRRIVSMLLFFDDSFTCLLNQTLFCVQCSHVLSWDAHHFWSILLIALDFFSSVLVFVFLSFFVLLRFWFYANNKYTRKK